MMRSETLAPGGQGPADWASQSVVGPRGRTERVTMHYVFGDYILDTQRYELHQAGVPIPLPPKVFQVLAYLLAQGDRVVSKEELLEHLWPGQSVGDGALNSYIMAVRKVLGDRGDSQRRLRTVRRRGYRLVAPVEGRDSVQPIVPLSAVPPPAAEVPARQFTSPPPRAGPPPEAGPAHPIAPLADGEYKPVSVLCCALVDAPALAARLSPEGLYRLLQTVLGLAREVVHHYAGTLTPYGSEGCTAVFGAPVAQEDHARRAVLAALELYQPPGPAHADPWRRHCSPDGGALWSGGCRRAGAGPAAARYSNRRAGLSGPAPPAAGRSWDDPPERGNLSSGACGGAGRTLWDPRPGWVANPRTCVHRAGTPAAARGRGRAWPAGRESLCGAVAWGSNFR
jgi:DNA-binding winged helix-turn-helix (wHTH) protein